MSHIFISYSHKDSAYAHRVANALQSKGFAIWIDERLDYGSQWPQEIQKQLDTCDAFILIMTPRSFASDWVQSELQRAKRKLKPVFPLLLEGDEPWLSVESTQFYDVRKGNLPDEKFFSVLERFEHSQKTTVEQVPGIRRSKISIFKLAGIRPEYTVAIIGAVATILAASLPFIFQNAPATNQVSVTTSTSAPIGNESDVLPVNTSTTFQPIASYTSAFTHTGTLPPTTSTPTSTLTSTASPTRTPSPTFTLPAGNVVGVIRSNGTLNCRKTPVTGAIVDSFPANTGLVFIGRIPDNSWLLVKDRNCWVSALYVTIARGSITSLQVHNEFLTKTPRP